MAPRNQPDRGFNDTDPMMTPPGGYRESAPSSSEVDERSSKRQGPRVIEEGGEGNREADRAYRDGVARTLATKDVDALADKAKRALDGPEGAALREAEKRAKSRPIFPKKQQPH